MKKRIAVLAAYWFIAFTFVLAQPAWAYIDPATTTYIIQIAAAIVITLGVSLSIFLYRFRMIITSLKVSIHALRQKMSCRKASTEAPEATCAEASAAQPSEDEALVAGLIDYPLPARDNYPAVVSYASWTDDHKAESNDVASEALTQDGRLRRLGRWLWKEDRRFKTRLLIAALISAGLSMTFVIFGMIDSVITNQPLLYFTLKEIIGPILILGLIIFAALTLILIAVRGRVFDFLVCLLLSLLICTYLQGTFFNFNVGQLIGLPLSWERIGVPVVIVNLIVWLAIIAIVFFLGLTQRAKLRRAFKRIAVFVPALILGVQLIALLSVFPSPNTPSPPGGGHGPRERSHLLTTTKNIYSVSPEKNTIVFIVDTFDNNYANKIVAEDPHFFDSLDGFTRFTNNMSLHNETFPSVVNLLTDVPYDPNLTSGAYIDKAYAQGSFVNDIRDQGYSSDIYVDYHFVYTKGEQLAGITDNLEVFTYSISASQAIKSLFKFSLLKVSPLSLKSAFWLPPNEFDKAAVEDNHDHEEQYTADDVKFFEGLKEEQLQMTDAPGHFTFCHLNGSHPPYSMNAQGEYAEGETNAVEQTKGCFLIINNYLEQMKALGIYQDATIIITGDHGWHNSSSLLEDPRVVGLFVKPAGAEGTPLKTNAAPVSIENMRATCVQAADGDSAAWGRTYFEVPEDEVRERHYYHRFRAGAAGQDSSIAHYRVIGDASDWKNWELLEVVSQDPRNTV